MKQRANLQVINRSNNIFDVVLIVVESGDVFLMAKCQKKDVALMKLIAFTKASNNGYIVNFIGV